jgi:hypothetical protein
MPARTSGLQRHEEMKRRNEKRRAKRYARDFGTRAEAVREMPCLVCGHVPSEPAHVRSRGAGGDRRSVVPLCGPFAGGHHREQHTRGIQTFQRKYGIDLHAEAARIAAELDEENYA